MAVSYLIHILRGCPACCQRMHFAMLMRRRRKWGQGAYVLLLFLYRSCWPQFACFRFCCSAQGGFARGVEFPTPTTYPLCSCVGTTPHHFHRTHQSYHRAPSVIASLYCMPVVSTTNVQELEEALQDGPEGVYAWSWLWWKMPTAPACAASSR